MKASGWTFPDSGNGVSAGGGAFYRTKKGEFTIIQLLFGKRTSLRRHHFVVAIRNLESRDFASCGITEVGKHISCCSLRFGIALTSSLEINPTE